MSWRDFRLYFKHSNNPTSEAREKSACFFKYNYSVIVNTNQGLLLHINNMSAINSFIHFHTVDLNKWQGSIGVPSKVVGCQPTNSYYRLDCKICWFPKSRSLRYWLKIFGTFIKLFIVLSIKIHFGITMNGFPDINLIILVCNFASRVTVKSSLAALG